MTAEIELPHNWRTRGYQRPAWDALHNGCRRCVLVWHRRAGKDSLALNYTVKQAILPPPKGRVGVYWHLFPTREHAKKALWDGIRHDGKPFLSCWPEQVIAKKNDSELTIYLRNGSIWQLGGSDYYNRLIGTNPVGVVFSEFSTSNPAAWDYIRPILAENDGWAIFPFTPRGYNHGYQLAQTAERLMGEGKPWFYERLTADDTKAITAEAIQAEREGGMSEEMIAQEFYCSWEAPLQGSYYGKLIADAEAEGRITGVPHQPAAEVETWWDLGVDDKTAIWFVQRVRKEVHVIDFFEGSGEGAEFYGRKLQELAHQRRYVYGDLVLPHDAAAQEFSSGSSPAEVLKSLGFRRQVVIPRQDVNHGIEAVRNLIPLCWFDRERCGPGIEALRQYRKDWDDKNRCWRQRPLHDWSSDAADAFRYGALHRGPSPGFRKIVYPRDHPCHGVI